MINCYTRITKYKVQKVILAFICSLASNSIGFIFINKNYLASFNCLKIFSVESYFSDKDTIKDSYVLSFVTHLDLPLPSNPDQTFRCINQPFFSSHLQKISPDLNPNASVRENRSLDGN